MLLISSSSLEEGVFEITAGIGMVVIYVLVPLPLEVPDEELDVIEHVDFFLPKYLPQHNVLTLRSKTTTIH